MNNRQRERLQQAALLLEEQTIPPADREASEEVLATIKNELENDDPDEGVLRQQLTILEKTAPAVADYMRRDAAPPAIHAQGLDDGFTRAQAILSEMTLSPVDREAVEEALEKIREAPDDTKEALAIIEHIAPSLLPHVVGEDE